MTLRIVFAGTPEFAVPCLRAATERNEVVAVYTQPDRPAGRGRGVAMSPVKREALLRGIDEHLVQAWETSMEKLLGKRADEATALERYQTFVRVSAQSATRAELMIMLESADPEAGERPWGPAVRRWAPSAPEAGNVDPTTLDNFVARLAADGLWIYEAMYEGQLDEGVRARVAERIAGLLAKSDGTSS